MTVVPGDPAGPAGTCPDTGGRLAAAALREQMPAVAM